MFAWVPVALVCAMVDQAANNISIHIRDLTAPERVARVPSTGPLTVLDAIASLKQPPAVIARMDVWLTRPTPSGEIQVLRIDWTSITRNGVTATNYVLQSGDRLYLQSRLAP